MPELSDVEFNIKLLEPGAGGNLGDVMGWMSKHGEVTITIKKNGIGSICTWKIKYTPPHNFVDSVCARGSGNNLPSAVRACLRAYLGSERPVVTHDLK